MDWMAEPQLLGELTSKDLERLFKEHSGCTETQVYTLRFLSFICIWNIQIKAKKSGWRESSVAHNSLTPVTGDLMALSGLHGH